MEQKFTSNFAEKLRIKKEQMVKEMEKNGGKENDLSLISLLKAQSQDIMGNHYSGASNLNSTTEYGTIKIEKLTKEIIARVDVSDYTYTNRLAKTDEELEIEVLEKSIENLGQIINNTVYQERADGKLIVVSGTRRTISTKRIIEAGKPMPEGTCLIYPVEYPIESLRAISIEENESRKDLHLLEKVMAIKSDFDKFGMEKTMKIYSLSESYICDILVSIKKYPSALIKALNIIGLYRATLILRILNAIHGMSEQLKDCKIQAKTIQKDYVINECKKLEIPVDENESVLELLKKLAIEGQNRNVIKYLDKPRNELVMILKNYKAQQAGENKKNSAPFVIKEQGKKINITLIEEYNGELKNHVLEAIENFFKQKGVVNV